MSTAYLVCACADAGLWRHEPWVDRERVAAKPGFATVPQLLYGVSSWRTYAGPPDEEGPAWPAEDGGQLPQVYRETVIFWEAAINCVQACLRMYRGIMCKQTCALNLSLFDLSGENRNWFFFKGNKKCPWCTNLNLQQISLTYGHEIDCSVYCRISFSTPL